MQKNAWWWGSWGLSAVLVATLAMQWRRVNAEYEPNESQLVDEAGVDRYLAAYEASQDGPPTVRVPTGVFVQSIRFKTGADVHVTGYVWQRYREGVHDGIERGFVLPEAVDSKQEQAYHRREGGDDVYGWYFEATLRQHFDYSKYPLDHKTVWVRLWHQEFDKDVILVPDLESYDSTGLHDTFGIDREIELGGWNVNETFFDYRSQDYDTNFGIRGYRGQREFPELYFNVVIHRDFLNAFVTNLVPLAICAALLFAIMLTVTGDRELGKRMGFSTTSVVGASSALFFVVMLAHVQLRNEFPASGIVYIERFFFMMYFVIIGVVANTYLFSMAKAIPIVQYRDNLIPKVTYWPVILLVMNLITYVSL